MIRNFLGVATGYAIFVVSSLLLFKLSGQSPHEDAINVFIIFAAIYGALFSIIAGFITQLIAKTGNLRVNYALTLLMAGIALFSLLTSSGSHWTQILAIVIFAPISILGGMLSKNKMPISK